MINKVMLYPCEVSEGEIEVKLSVIIGGVNIYINPNFKVFKNLE